ncbi:MAG TPA: GntR family transcriptional regulator [Burkholderiaceae bacterium]
MRAGVYEGIRTALTRGHFSPGEKLILRQLAEQFGVSLTPVREALYRLVVEGVLTQEHSRSVRVPVLSRQRVLELRDMRLALEMLAVTKGAELASAAEIARLERLTAGVEAARKAGHVIRDNEKVAEFQFALYATSRMPVLLRHIEMLWLQTGPYMRLLHPTFIAYVQQVRPGWRREMCQAYRERDVAKARALIETDVSESLSHLAELVGATEILRPPP